ncbi:Threonylcarbamoyl-AMP synthase [Symmachiella dynata]|uniref:Threonylcarbamoyl-AMP synthase n=1 Tax=Symmachiella dynata TaxID=2527995 RepID=A0A517ZLA5_9PLAN|nr:L-threonylcarbamoyladenylate synthase [Symmachiella dynata]QDU43248.1 Threonylcarbamoyl-AMP synthase [Symmachiella dynata]
MSTPPDIKHAAQLLRDGGLVAIPTETVYGLAAHALDPLAVARVFAAKGRPKFDPLIVHVPERAELADLVSEFPATAVKLADQFWPGPLTMVLPKRDVVPDIVTAGLSSVAIRIPDHPVAQALLKEAGIPLAAPSANPFGRLSPTTAAHVREQLGDAVDFILDGGPCRVGVESTVVQITGDQVQLLRPGGVTLEELEAVVGSIVIPAPDAHPSSAAQPSPGTLPQHYAPGTPLILTVDDQSPASGKRTGLLCLTAPEDTSAYIAVEELSNTGNLTEAAANFFAAMRRLDAAGLDVIVAQPFPNKGLGRALNDRLTRAATK